MSVDRAVRRDRPHAAGREAQMFGRHGDGDHRILASGRTETISRISGLFC